MARRILLPGRFAGWAAAAAIALLVVARPTPAAAQVGRLVSPGPLSKAHAALEGVANCQKCHEPGRQVTADRCLSCHQPVAERIRARRGVHRDVRGDCVTCHVEHAGVDAELRPFDRSRFDHARDAGFPLDGRHLPIARDCARCHKGRSFLAARPACASCHADVHKGALGPTCTSCHSTAERFAAARTSFDHSRAAFPLTGAHRTVACARCHAGGAFKGVAFASCTSCHKDPHRATFGPTCTSCHTTDAWKTRTVDHARTGFPLRGRHADVACVKCHVKPPMTARVKADRCADCHTDPHRGQFTQDCSACHQETGFKGAPFDHAKQTRFPLAGRHAALACWSCHKGVVPGAAVAGRTVDFRGASTACASCHTDPHRGELGTSCERCHGAETFRVERFTHQGAPELFAGQHAGVACAACHVARDPRAPTRTGRPVDGWRFTTLSRSCSTCHADVHLGQVGRACERCHAIGAARFAVVGFSHASTSFALTGRHVGLACAQCHKRETGTFPAGTGTAVRLKGLGTTCAACHTDVHLGQLGPSCERCHATTAFKIDRYTHQGKEAFFTGVHAAQPCAACHKRETGAFPAGPGTAVRYTGSGTACATCHTDAHQGTLGRTCETCHAPEGWRAVSRAFHKVTRLPLEGRHLVVACAECHRDGVMKGTPFKCADCHWFRRQDDPYRTRLGIDCERCHRPTSWTAVSWDHGAATGMPLGPIHRTLGCATCHRDGVFTGTAPTCLSCHRDDYQRAASPNHVAAGFPTSCEMCHRPSHAAWRQATFRHDTFPLTGAHATGMCAACHGGGQYAGTPRECVACHRAAYERTTSPAHAAAGFPTTCEMCHQASAPRWSASFNHASVYPLVGTHATQPCIACHKNNVYRGTPRDCVGCHRANYDRTTNPNHAAAGFPTTCETCHQPSAPRWSASFNHASIYPLVGTHATQPCIACHRGNVYKGTPRDCVGCHRANYDRTTNPNHAAAGFPTTCETCHQAGSATWTGTFNHNAYFPLLGRHLQQPCAACHRNNVYRGTPRDCYPCHQSNYDQTRNPNHRAAGFPTTCESCHQASDGSWNQGRFTHTWFPITSGKHAGNPCSACHTDPNSYKVFTCLTCHDRAKMDSEHRGRAGYRYESQACYACHPQGRE